MEIVQTGDLQRLKYEKTPDVAATKLFQGIYGVGQGTAYAWFNAGCRTLEDVRQRKGEIKLNAAQEIGLEFYDDINQRMPREEVGKLFELIKPIALQIDPKLFIEVMGSYRRGKATCGDIDVLITRPTDDGKTHAGVLRRLLKALHKGPPLLFSPSSHFRTSSFAAGIITEDLTVPASGELDGLEAVYRGLCRLLDRPDRRRRRIDFLSVPWSSRGAALLYYTGDDVFNRAMRFKANHLGLSLNQRGLFEGVVRDPADRRVKLHKGVCVASETEGEIFRRLDVPWQEPHERVRS